MEVYANRGFFLDKKKLSKIGEPLREAMARSALLVRSIASR